MKLRNLIAGAIAVGTLAAAGTANAATQTVSGSVGPVPVPNAPVQVCVNTNCQQTPALSSVSLNATATSDSAGTLPTITPGTCSSGVGGTLVVNGGSSSTTVSGTVSGTLPDGSQFSQPIPPTTVAPNGTTTISACTTTTSPVPLPNPPPVPSPTGLLDLILSLLSQLLGGALPF